MANPVRALTEGVGALVYGVSYPVIWIIWNIGGKHIVLAFRKVAEDSNRVDADEIIGEGADLTALRKLLLNAYYNRCFEEARCGRFD